jgi:hypothetical protein
VNHARLLAHLELSEHDFTVLVAEGFIVTEAGGHPATLEDVLATLDAAEIQSTMQVFWAHAYRT